MEYVLKKDLPTLDAGVIFKQLEDFNNLIYCNEYRFLTSISNFNDWFEPIKWRPEKGKEYWYIETNIGNLWVSHYINDNDIYDNGRINQNNCFKTKEEAQEKLNKILKILINE